MAARPQPELDAPRGEAAKGLASLIAARQQLDVRLDEIDRQQRQAHEDAARLSAELADLERAALRGEQVSAKEREAAEKALTKAKIAAGEPWAERRAGVQGAMRDEDRELRTFAADHMDTLLVEVGEDAQEAAQAVNQAAARLIDAYESSGA